MNNLTSKDTIKKGSGVEVDIEANLAANRAMGAIKYRAGKEPSLKDYYSRLIEVSTTFPEVVKATIDSFITEYKQA